MSIQRLHTDTRMSQAVIHGGTVYLSGQVDLENPAKTVAEQTQRVLQRIDQLLAQAGTDKTQLLSATIWLADISHFTDMNQAWVAWLPEGCAPARATVEARLAFPSLLVEVAVVAALPAGAPQNPAA